MKEATKHGFFRLLLHFWERKMSLVSSVVLAASAGRAGEKKNSIKHALVFILHKYPCTIH